MAVLADVVDAVVGGDTHRDVHALELVAPDGASLSTLTISNDDGGFADAMAWIAEHAPGPQVVIALEGTRSYGIGLPRALAAAGLPVVEIERPARRDRRRGKSDPIDAHLAALHALRLQADRLPIPRADGDREALRILLGARRELSTAKTRMVNRLRALLLTGEDDDRMRARGKMDLPVLTTIARRRGRAEETREQAVRALKRVAWRWISAMRIATSSRTKPSSPRWSCSGIVNLGRGLATGMIGGRLHGGSRGAGWWAPVRRRTRGSGFRWRSSATVFGCTTGSR